MSAGVLLDTGPLVAYIDPRDGYHDWAVATFEGLSLPVVTCEAVLTEACFLIGRSRLSPNRVLEHVGRAGLRVGLSIEKEITAIGALMQRYANVPMSLADACLVRLAEMTGLPICTLDSDFAIYRTHGRRAIEMITPTPRHLHEP